ncbi:platelet-activating factor acetylhydrolase IB subunit alpha2-like [Lineus longissimus]|uniref:platelet-activating factor acetylhydrolase IB subunit alpha2-like n=1 Tax=Lineus longissimus TaxID=88925 RepID=UPI002B4DD734
MHCSKPKGNPAAIPVKQEDTHLDGRWMSLHEDYVSEAMGKEPDVLFVGDSLIQHLAQTQHWKNMFEQLHCLNFGIAKDQTQHVLWRLENGELENILPKVIVLLIGTNNHDHSAEEIAGGIEAIVDLLLSKQPQAQIIVLGIPPRGKHPNSLRTKLGEVNTMLLGSLKDKPKVTFLDVGKDFVEEGQISRLDMYDYLHFTHDGYQKFCEPLLEEIQDIVGITKA